MAQPIKQFKQGDRWYVRAQQIWVILIAHAMRPRRDPKHIAKISYGTLAKRMGFADGRAGHVLSDPLYIIGRYCAMNGLPALNTLVVKADSREPGDAVFKRTGRTVEQEQAEVMEIDWFAYRIPTTGTLREVWEETREAV